MNRRLRATVLSVFCLVFSGVFSAPARAQGEIDAADRVKGEELARLMREQLDSSGLKNNSVYGRAAANAVRQILRSDKFKDTEFNRRDVRQFIAMVESQAALDMAKARTDLSPEEKQKLIQRASDEENRVMGDYMSSGPAEPMNEFHKKYLVLVDKYQSGGGHGHHGSSGGGSVGLPPRGSIDDMTRADPSPANYNLSARDRLAQGDVSGALNDVNQAIGNGGGADSYALRGDIYLGQDKYAQAAGDAKKALELAPGHEEATALLQFSQGRGEASSSASAPAGWGEMGASAPRVAFSAPSNAAASKQAENALRLGDYGEAMAHVNRGLAQSPGDPSLMSLRSSIHAGLREYSDAVEDAKAGLEKAPKDRTLLRKKAYAEVRSKKWTDAIATANRLLELDPSDAYAYAARAHAYGGMGDRDAMMSDINRAAQLDPRFQQAAADAAKLQLPTDADVLFLFPGEEAPAEASKSAGGRARRFGVLVGLSALGGLLLALGLLSTVLAPLKTRASALLTRITRRRPEVGALAAAGEEEATPNLISGQYQISRQIGAGGMGRVFEGTDRALGRRVAIKKMRDEIRLDPRERERFVAEAKTVAALHHPSIVDIYAIAEDGDDVFLVFEYVEGRTIHDIVQTRGRLEPNRAARVVRAAAEALDYAHSRGVVHRDMKPSNMMIDARGHLKLMDFGIARVAKKAMTRAAFTNTNTVVGTPPYMAPEQEEGQVRRESDVYALAVCAYEMLCGKLPFAGVGSGMLLNKIKMNYVPLSRVLPGLPPALDAVFARAFQADPEQRYRTPGEFAAALESALPAATRA